MTEKEPPEQTRYVRRFDVVETETELPIQGSVVRPNDLYVFFRDMQNEVVPKVVVAYLNDENIFLGHQVFVGVTSATLDSSLIYHYYSLFLAKKFIVMVNHPAGDCDPTTADQQLFSNLMHDSASLSFRPRLLDFMVIGSKKFSSMQSAPNQAYEHGTEFAIEEE